MAPYVVIMNIMLAISWSFNITGNIRHGHYQNTPRREHVTVVTGGYGYLLLALSPRHYHTSHHVYASCQ